MKRSLVGWSFVTVMGVLGSAVFVSRIGAADSQQTNARPAAERDRDDDRRDRDDERGRDRDDERGRDRDDERGRGRDDGGARDRDRGERGEREMDRDRRERRREMEARRRPGRDRGPDRGDHAGRLPRRIDHTIKLEFRLINEDDQPTFHVLVVAPEFAIEHEVSDPNGAHHIGFRGELIPIDEGRLLLHYAVEMNHQNNAETEEASFETRGSAFLGLDKPTKLATLGQAVVQVTATIEK